MYDVAAIGELLIDFTVDRIQEDGYPVMAAHPGGAPANFLAALTKYGKKTAMIAKVGDDALGRQLVRTLQQVGIDGRGVLVDGSVFTTLAFVTRDANGEREFSFARKPGADMLLTADEVPYDLIDQSKVLHFGTVCMTNEPSRTAHYKAVEYARQQGKLVTFDPNLREPLWADLEDAKEQMFWGFRHADVVKISDNEVEFLFGCSVEEGAEKLLKEFGVKLVSVTLGKDGCYFANGKGSGRVPGVTDINVVDTTGAGDIFGGSAVTGLLELGKAPEDVTVEEMAKIAAFACTAASLSTTNLGGIFSVPERAAVEARVQQ